jgi:hypothetical protein
MAIDSFLAVKAELVIPKSAAVLIQRHGPGAYGKSDADPGVKTHVINVMIESDELPS